MKAKLKANNASKLQQDSQIKQLSDFTELSDQEMEMLVGGDGLTVTDVKEFLANTWQDLLNLYSALWGGGGGSGGGSGGSSGGGGG